MQRRLSFGEQMLKKYCLPAFNLAEYGSFAWSESMTNFFWEDVDIRYSKRIKGERSMENKSDGFANNLIEEWNSNQMDARAKLKRYVTSTIKYYGTHNGAKIGFESIKFEQGVIVLNTVLLPMSTMLESVHSVVETAKCNGCGKCVEHCSFDALTLENKLIYSNQNCVGCGSCIQHCSETAISLKTENRQCIQFQVYKVVKIYGVQNFFVYPV